MRVGVWILVAGVLVACTRETPVKLGRRHQGLEPHPGGFDTGGREPIFVEECFGEPFEVFWDGESWHGAMEEPVLVCIEPTIEGCPKDPQSAWVEVGNWLDANTSVDDGGDTGCTDCGSWAVGEILCGPQEQDESCCYTVSGLELAIPD